VDRGPVIAVLRHQLQVLRRQVGRLRFRWSDRLIFAAASRHLARETWRAFLVTPQTVLRWHCEPSRRPDPDDPELEDRRLPSAWLNR